MSAPQPRPDGRAPTAGPRGHLRGRHVVWALIVGVLVVAAAIAAGWVIARPDDHDFWSDLIRSAVLAAGAIAAVPAGYVAYRKQQTTEAERQDEREKQLHVVEQADLVNTRADTLEQQRRDELVQATVRADAKDYRDRYAAAAGQLGSDKAAIRLAGVYALAQLADEWGRTERDQRQVCIDVLCAYLRMPWPTPPATPPVRSTSRSGRRLAGHTMGPGPEPTTTADPREVVEETQVRAAILRTTAAHLHKDQDPDTAWWANDFDLTDARLPTLNLTDVRIEGTFNATSATFSGAARFTGTTFSGAAEFPGAKFSGRAEFAGAEFLARTGFGDATFFGDAGFEGATFFGRTGFEGATFFGDAGFDGATFFGDAADAWFGGATFSKIARFEGATFSGTAWFRGVTFSGDAGFEGATFSGDAGFEDATFSRIAGFEDATFSSSALFRGATFSRNAQFGGATFSGAAGFRGATFSGDVWFEGATFFGDAGFEGATFSGVVSFEGAAFCLDAWFEGATFLEAAEVTNAEIGGTVSRPDGTTDAATLAPRPLGPALFPDEMPASGAADEGANGS